MSEIRAVVLYDHFSQHRTVRELGEYWRLFWELSLAAPIRYLDDAPILPEAVNQALKHNARTDAAAAAAIIDKIRKRQAAFEFDVMFDNVSLRKPTRIPRVRDVVEPRLTPIRFNEKIRGSQLRLEGYVYSQNKAIYPAELRGILIRVKNVAIGDYNPAFLKYEIVEGFRFDWVSAEVYVEEGLQDALNIDRNSFNEVHPHYLALQREIHRVLREQVFPEAQRAATEGRKRKVVRINVDADRQLVETIGRVLGEEYELRRNGEDGSDEPVTVDPEAGLVMIHPHAIWPSRQTERAATEKVIIAHCLAQRHGRSTAQTNDIFLKLLRGAFSA